MKSFITALLIISWAWTVCAAQEIAGNSNADQSANSFETRQRLQLAISNEDYPVTPGDVYRLSFRQADTPVIIDLLVESNYTINMKVFGSMNAGGMTFTQLKPVVEKAVSVAYPRSMPSLSIYSLGIFQIYLKGETDQSQSIVAWGMSRLSDILQGKLESYSCLRNIKIISLKGVEKQYDLFQFQRLGLADQNPYVKPGDTILISGSERTIEIAGEIKHPGKYQLLRSEKLNDLVTFFGGGLTTSAETARVRIDRASGETPRTFYIRLGEDANEQVALEDGDIITIPSKIAALPTVFFEGAVSPDAGQGSTSTQSAQNSPVGYNRISYSFRQGETLRSALIAVRKSVSPMGNLSDAFLVREGIDEPIPIDLEALLSGVGPASEMPLCPLDRIIIPQMRFTVFVSGAVDKPGALTYAPGQTYQYYVTLAGGSTQETPERVSIVDSVGKARDPRDVIYPEDKIFVMPETVKVQGAVFTPGSFSYRQGLPVSYYVNLAGGIDPERNGNSEVHLFDSTGKARKAGEAISPGDLIYAPNNTFSYSFTKYAPLVATLLTLVVDTIVIFSNWNR